MTSKQEALIILGSPLWSGRLEAMHAVARTLMSRGAEVWVAAGDSQTGVRFAQAGARVLPGSAGGASIQGIHRLCRRHQFSLVITSGQRAGLIGGIGASLARAPLVVHHARPGEFTASREGLAAYWDAAVRRMTARVSHFIVTATAEDREAALRDGVAGPDRIETIYPGIDLARYRRVSRTAARERLGFAAHETIIGTLGTDADRSGCETLLHAMVPVLARFPAARLVFSGYDRWSEELRQEAALLGFDDRVTFLGGKRDTAAVLASYDILVLPSRRNASAGCLLDAMASGRPIVACNTAANAELIHHGTSGMLASPGDSGALAGAICCLLANADLAASYAAAALEAVARRFVLERSVEQHLRLYDRLLGRAASSPSAGRASCSAVAAGGAQ